LRPLLEINLWSDLTYQQIVNWSIKDRLNPYLYKNIILIPAQAYPTRLEEYLRSADITEEHIIVNRAIYYAKVKRPAENYSQR